MSIENLHSDDYYLFCLTVYKIEDQEENRLNLSEERISDL